MRFLSICFFHLFFPFKWKVLQKLYAYMHAFIGSLHYKNIFSLSINEQSITCFSFFRKKDYISHYC